MKIFVTGASGWIGTAVVPDLINAGHDVVGLARSDDAAAALRVMGAQVVRGSIDDVDVLRAAAAAADGVIHLAFRHDIAFSGGFVEAAQSDRRAIEAFGDALSGSGSPLVIASGVVGLTANTAGAIPTELDGHTVNPNPTPAQAGPEARRANAEFTLSLADRGIRSAVVRLAPTCHGPGDQGFMASIVGIARAAGVSGYLGDGSNRWPATHRLDAAKLFRLALEHAPAGSTLHAVAEEGVRIGDVAAVIARQLDIPLVSVAPDDAGGHFTFLAGLIGLDSPVSSARTRELTGWNPTQPGLLADLESGHYFRG